MAPSYRDTLEHIRRAFPQPVSDPIHDSYFVHSIMRTLDQVDALKTELPLLGPVFPGDFAEARNAALPTGMSSVEEVTSELVGYLRGMTISSHPRTQQNVRVISTASLPLGLQRRVLVRETRLQLLGRLGKRRSTPKPRNFAVPGLFYVMPLNLLF